MANVLLLQGPFGPFFRRLAKDMEADGVTVHKVNFNAGDALFFRHRNAVSFRGRVEDWPAFLEDLIEKRDIQQIYLFGDYRVYHKLAVKLAEKKGIPVYVFEEGYLRPDFITMEEGGMHCNSRMPRDPEFYRNLDLPEPEPAKPVGKWIGFAVFYGAIYYIISNLLRFAYPHYQHHRGFSTLKQGPVLITKGVLYLWNKFKDRRKSHIFNTWLSGRYFFVALQVRDDATILQNSEYKTVACFIKEVVKSFAEHADPKDFLVIKHHPFDTSFRGYAKLIKQLKEEYDLGDRLLYIHHMNVPMLLKNAKGTVVVNSTVGMSSIHHGTPVKVMGKAVYDFQGLTTGGPLNEFWKSPQPINYGVYRQFRRYLLFKSQLNANFYRKLSGCASETGLDWKGRAWNGVSSVYVKKEETSQDVFGTVNYRINGVNQ